MAHRSSTHIDIKDKCGKGCSHISGWHDRKGCSCISGWHDSRSWKIIPFITLLLILVACSKTINYAEVHDFKRDVWTKEEMVNFKFIHQGGAISSLDDGSVAIGRADRAKRLDIIVRHTPNFRYNALALEIKITAPDQLTWSDTISLPLRDNKGGWAGKNMRSHYENVVTYRSKNRFDQEGLYTIRFQQLNTTDKLEGVKAIGLIIEEDGER